MATSGVITGNLTAREATHMAHELALAKVVNEGRRAASAYDADVALRHLNWTLKSMGADACPVYRSEEINITWPADEAEQILDINYLDITEMRVRDANDIDRQLSRIDTEDYRALPNKFQSGQPISFSLGRTVSTMIVRLWPVPSAETELYATAERVIEDVTSLDEDLDIPQEWTEAVVYKLAVRLNRAYGFSGTPEHAELAQAAEGLYQLVKSADEPQSLFLSPG